MMWEGAREGGKGREKKGGGEKRDGGRGEGGRKREPANGSFCDTTGGREQEIDREKECVF